MVFSGFKASSAKTFIEFLWSFWVNLVVLPLLLMSMVALPPLQCYVGSTENVTLSGAILVIVIGTLCYLYDWRQDREQRAGGGSSADEIMLYDILSADEKEEEEEEVTGRVARAVGDNVAGHLVIDPAATVGDDQAGDRKGTVYRLVMY